MYSLVQRLFFTVGALSSQYQAAKNLCKKSYVDTQNTIKAHNIEMNPLAMNLDLTGCPEIIKRK